MASYKIGKFFTRKFSISEAEPPADVKEAFVKFSDGKNPMTADQLLQFLVNFQGESKATIEDAERIIGQIMQRRHQIAKFTRHALTLDDFHHYLFSDDLNPSINPQVSQDMTAPLSHYFIYTGHNSYLTGNQLSSDCSDEPIIKALQKGVRVIELDLWPNSSKDDVHVFHGRTLTTPVTLIKCLRSIKEYAFCASPYPLVITLEDHLTPKLRVKVAEMLTQTFEDMLFFPESECLEEFPSPEALKHRILISTKPPSVYLEGTSFKDKGKVSPEDEASSKEVVDFKNELEADDSDRSENNEKDEDDDDCDNQLGASEYKRLIAIHANKHKGEFTVSLKVIPGKVGRLSLSEPALEKATESHGTELIRFTQRNLLRVYPKGTRVDSSNYDPMIAWMHGAQMVAFNMQGHGKLLWLMQGMFRSNGGCGYVKKPDFLMTVDQRNHIFNAEGELPVKKTLKVRVYMGDGWSTDFKKTHFDAFSPPDFYVKMKIAGVPADVTKKKTKILEDDSKPVWDEEFLFPLTVPELALLRIKVLDYDMSEKDDFGGQTCLPVWELRSGIRAVPLFNSEGEKFKSVKLLMRFEFV
ncbi:C2 calcium-dependent membrane targeting [Macleaya cordata]|uniref:Phosphoinositide phospholipase C n=1 Tax=Macleaya cordata TaxID=56857 RepID=A0A200PLM4_MACCD|nr:C2 calcium-dependent membrane targeting [Macleaya cordata]